MIVIIDTNVLISAILRDRDPEAVVLFASETSGVRWLASAVIMAEYRTVLVRPKFELSPELIARWMALLDRVVELVEVSASVEFSRDRKDGKFLDCAVATGADFFVTGDKDFAALEVAQRIGKTIVISVAMFKKLVCDQYGKGGPTGGS